MASKSEVTLTFTGKDRDLMRTFGRVESRSGKLQGALVGVGKGAAVMGAAVVGGAVIGGKALFDLGANFDAASDIIVEGTGATGKQLEDLNKSFDKVLASGPHSMESTATAIADVNTALGHTGKPLEELSGQFLDLSKITKEDLGGQIQSLTRVMGDWAVSADDQSLALDKLHAISQATGVGVTDLGNNMVKFGAPLRQLGFTMDESAALMGKWHKEGVNLETIMGGLRQGISKMARSGEDVPTAFRAAIESIEQAGSSSEATTLAIETFGARAGPDLAAAVREGRFSIEDLMGVMEDAEGSISRTAGETESFQEKWQQFKNQLSVAFKPAAIKVFDLMGKAVEKLGPILTDHVIPAIESFFSSLEGAGDSESTIRKVFDTIISAGQSAHTFITGTVIPFIVLVWQTIQKVWGHIGPDVTRIFNQVMSVIGAAVEFIVTTIQFGTKVARAIWDRWGGAITLVAKSAWAVISAVIGGALTVIEGIFRTATAIMRGDWSAAWAGIRMIASGMTTAIKGIIRAAWNFISTVTRTIWTGIKNFIGRQVDNTKNWVKRAIDSIIRFFIGIPGRIARALSGLASKIGEPFRKGYESAKRWLNKIPGAGAVAGVGGAIRKAVPFFHSGGIFRTQGSAKEGLAMLRDGEGVVTPEHMQGIKRGEFNVGGGGGMVTIMIDSGGSRTDEFLLELLRKSVRNRGGDVQAVIGG